MSCRNLITIDVSAAAAQKFEHKAVKVVNARPDEALDGTTDFLVDMATHLLRHGGSLSLDDEAGDLLVRVTVNQLAASPDDIH